MFFKPFSSFEVLEHLWVAHMILTSFWWELMDAFPSQHKNAAEKWQELALEMTPKPKWHSYSKVKAKWTLTQLIPQFALKHLKPVSKSAFESPCLQWLCLGYVMALTVHFNRDNNGHTHTHRKKESPQYCLRWNMPRSLECVESQHAWISMPFLPFLAWSRAFQQTAAVQSFNKTTIWHTKRSRTVFVCNLSQSAQLFHHCTQRIHGNYFLWKKKISV